MQQQGVAGGDSGPSPARVSLADRYCDAVDRANSWIGRFFAFSIFAVVLAVLYEVFARSMFGQATIWSGSYPEPFIT